MRKNKLLRLLGIETVICLIFVLIGWRLAGVFSSWMAFPFEQIGRGLRVLSLSGKGGNIAAIAIYAVLCLFPLGYLIYRARKGKAEASDFLLVLMSGLLLAVMYFMINPGMIGIHFGAYVLGDAGKAFMGGTVYSVIAGYVIYKLLRRISESDTKAVLDWLSVPYIAICAFLVIIIFGQELYGLLDSFTQYQIENTDYGPHMMSYIFMALQYFVSVLPYALELGIVFMGLNLIEALREDAYSDKVVAAAIKLAGLCKSAVIAIMGSQIALNVLQLIAGSAVRVSSFKVSIPFNSIAVVMIAFLAAKYFQKGKEIKDDLDAII